MPRSATVRSQNSERIHPDFIQAYMQCHALRLVPPRQSFPEPTPYGPQSPNDPIRECLGLEVSQPRSKY